MATAYGDDVARAISKYGDDGIKIAQEFGEETAEKCLKLVDDAVESVGKTPKPGNPDFIGPLKEVDAARANNWTKPDGSTWWPSNRGFDGTPVSETLKPGTLIDRYGYDGGTFVSPEGTPYTNRALAPGTGAKPYTKFEVLKPIDVQSGKIASWFGEKGGGMQYELSKSISELLEEGIIGKVVK